MLCLSVSSVLVAESGNSRVQEVTVADGTHRRFIGVDVLKYPQCVHATADAVVVSEVDSPSRFARVCVFGWSDGATRCTFGSYGAGPSMLRDPYGVHLSHSGTEVCGDVAMSLFGCMAMLLRFAVRLCGGFAVWLCGDVAGAGAVWMLHCGGPCLLRGLSLLST